MEFVNVLDISSTLPYCNPTQPHSHSNLA